jgi:hypothetical protein
MTQITGDRLLAANSNVPVHGHLDAISPSDSAATAECASPQPFEVRLGRPAGLLLDLPPGTCRWPLGDLDDPHFRWCGCPSTPGAPYCAAHMQLSRVRCYRKAGETASGEWEHSFPPAQVRRSSTTLRTGRPSAAGPRL